MVAHGNDPIPPVGWGAVEHVIWQYTTHLRSLGHTVSIVNEHKWKAIALVGRIARSQPIDIIHCHAEKPVRWLQKLSAVFPNQPLVVSTTHNPLNADHLTASELKALSRCHFAKFHLTLRQDISQLIRERNPRAICAVQPNGVECDKFRNQPTGNGKAVIVGRLQERKKQNPTALALHQAGIEAEFFGPNRGEIELNPELESMYRGELPREELMKKLCEYSCLVLMSDSEGQPLVVIEALAAGIPVVVSPAAAANLDLSLPFIHVVQNFEDLSSAVRLAMNQRNDSAQTIRAYAQSNFDFQSLVQQYIRQCSNWRNEHGVSLSLPSSPSN